MAAGAEACRLVHGEGDGIPSLIVDRYRDHLVIQTLSQGTDRAKAEIVEILVDLLAPKGVVERNDPKVRALEGLESTVSVLHGEVPETVEVNEGDVRFLVDLRRGQKTGLFLDQRENHLAARGYARGRVLDGFTYDGGFALQVARDADEVLAVDLSADALERVKSNATLNGLDQRHHEGRQRLRPAPRLRRRRRALRHRDPGPAGLRQEPQGGGQGGAGLQGDQPPGPQDPQPRRVPRHLLVLVPRPRGRLRAPPPEAAVDAGVTVSLVEKRRQARDHPVLLGVPETHYLKCFVLRKER